MSGVLLIVGLCAIVAVVLGAFYQRSPGRQVQVFVDDAVNGALPMVCVKAGTAADGLFPLTIWNRRFNPLWLLLILLGPLGWIALLVVVLVGDRRERLVVRLPMAETTVDRYVQSRRRLISVVTVLVGAVAVLAFLGIGLGSDLRTGQAFEFTLPLLVVLLAAAGVALGIVGLRAASRAWSSQVRVELDASRRWVTLSGVSDEFARAVAADERTTAAR